MKHADTSSLLYFFSFNLEVSLNNGWQITVCKHNTLLHTLWQIQWTVFILYTNEVAVCVYMYEIPTF